MSSKNGKITKKVCYCFPKQLIQCESFLMGRTSFVSVLQKPCLFDTVRHHPHARTSSLSGLWRTTTFSFPFLRQTRFTSQTNANMEVTLGTFTSNWCYFLHSVSVIMQTPAVHRDLVKLIKSFLFCWDCQRPLFNPTAALWLVNMLGGFFLVRNCQ